MYDPLRRRVLKWGMSLPFAGQLFGRAVPGSREVPGGFPARRSFDTSAVNFIRVLNTAEAWHKIKFGSYASRDQLLDSGILSDALSASLWRKPDLLGDLPQGQINWTLRGWNYNCIWHPRRTGTWCCFGLIRG